MQIYSNSKILNLSENEIFLKYDLLLKKIAWKFSRKNTSFTSYDDIYSIATIGFTKSLKTYKLDHKTEFCTYFTTVVYNEIFMFLRKMKLEIKTINYEDYFDDKTYDINENNLINDLDFNNLIKKLNAKDQFIYELIYDKKLSQIELSKIFKISQPYASRLVKRLNLKLIYLRENDRRGKNGNFNSKY
jgi:RNA polymerase sigma factor (sigma-70 family)